MKWCAVVSVLAFALVGMPSAGHAWFKSAQEIKAHCLDNKANYVDG